MVKEFKHLRGNGLGSLTHPWSLYLMVPMFHASYDTGNSINYGSMYFVLGGASPGRELPCGPG